MSDPTHKAVAIIEQRDVEKMSPVVAAAMTILRENPSPDALDKLLAVQERWEANEAKKRFAQAMVDLKRDLPTVLKHDKTVHFEGKSGGVTHFTHTTLASASEQLTPILAQYGFAMTFVPSTTERGISVKCQLRHSAGHVEESSMSAGPDTTGPMKNPVQQAMSSVTYLKRYLMLSMLGIATADMPDADDAPAPDPERIDTDRNMRAVEALKKYGKTRKDAEEHLGKTIAGWTTEDIARLKSWLKPAEGD